MVAEVPPTAASGEPPPNGRAVPPAPWVARPLGLSGLPTLR